MTLLEVVDLPADRLPGDLLTVPLFEDQKTLDGPAALVDWRLDGLLSRMMLGGELSGRTGEHLALQSNTRFAAPWLLLVGCGRWQSLGRDGYLEVVERLLSVSSPMGISALALCLSPGEGVDAREIERIVQEVLVGRSRLDICRLSHVARLA